MSNIVISTLADFEELNALKPEKNNYIPAQTKGFKKREGEALDFL